MNYLKAFYYYCTHNAKKYAELHGVKKEKKIIKDMKKCLFKYGLYYEEYFLFDCIDNDDNYKKSFISELNRYDIYKKYNKSSYTKLFQNKKLVYERYSKFYNREVITLETVGDLEKFKEFCSKHNEFIIKPFDKSCGVGVKKISTNFPNEAFNGLQHKFPLLCEEIIIQDETLAEFNSTSVNTVRLVTILRENGVDYFYPFIRFGRYGSVVDNGGMGGIIVPINVDSGKLYHKGRDETGKYYRVHPDSKKAFDGFVIPRWDELFKFAQKVSRITPECKLIGFDFALTKNGWIMVEANIHGQFIGQQMIDLVGKYNEL